MTCIHLSISLTWGQWFITTTAPLLQLQEELLLFFFFLECVAFYLLLGWSENCQAPHTWKWKVEVPAYLLNWSLIAQLWELSLDL